MNQSESATQRPGRALHIVLWAAQILLAAYFLWEGGNKLLGSDAAVRLFSDIGLGQWFRYVTGAAEVAGAIGLLIPRLYGLAALGLVGVMVGATATNLMLGSEGQEMNYTPLALQTGVLAVVFALIAWGRWSETRGLIATVLKR